MKIFDGQIIKFDEEVRKTISQKLCLKQTEFIKSETILTTNQKDILMPGDLFYKKAPMQSVVTLSQEEGFIYCKFVHTMYTVDNFFNPYIEIVTYLFHVDSTLVFFMDKTGKICIIPE